MTATETKAWRGDPIKKRMRKGDEIYLDDLGGWRFVENEPLPIDRAVWVITEYQRRCIIFAGTFARWAICDEKCYFWHDSKIGSIRNPSDPPDFPAGFRVEHGAKNK